MTRSTPHRGWMLWGVLLVFFLLVPALIAGCSDNKGSKGPSYGSSITGTATNGLFILSVNLNPNMVQPGQSAGITVLATTINGAPLEGRSVQLSTTGGTLSTVAGKTDAAGKFVATITIDVKDTSASQTITAIVDGVSVTGTLYIGAPGLLAILPLSVTMAPGATQVFQASGGVEPYRWEVSGGTLNRYNEPTVIFTAGSAVGTFYLTVRDAAGNSKSASITIEAFDLNISPTTATLRPGQTQTFTATGGTPPYSWNASGGSLNTTSGSSVTYTAGSVGSATGITFEVRVTDSRGKSKDATVTVQVPAPTLLPETVTRTYGATGSVPGTCSVGTVTITFTVTGGVPPYTFSATAGTVSPSTLTAAGTVTYSITPGTLTGGTERTETITVLDSAGQSDTSTVTIECTATS